MKLAQKRGRERTLGWSGTLFAAVLGSLVTADHTGLAQDWIATSAPSGYWYSVASSADGTRLVAASYLDANLNKGQIYVSTNSGSSWRPSGAPLNQWKYVASSADGSKLLATADYDGIYTSTNWGATWRSNGVQRAWGFAASSSDGATLALAPEQDLIYISTNSGSTWNVATKSPTNCTCVTMSADGRTMVTCHGLSDGIGSFVYVSTNSGATWNLCNLPSTIGAWEWYSIACSTDGRKIVVAGSGNSAPIFTSTDQGSTWNRSGAPGISGGWSSVACSADGTKLVAVGGDSQGSPVYTSADAGATWTLNNAPLVTWYSVASSADGTKLVAVNYYSAYNGAGIYVSHNSPAVALPLLNIGLSGGIAVVSWLTNASGLELQENPDLGTTNWAIAASTPTIANGFYQVAVLPTNRQSFFRLISH